MRQEIINSSGFDLVVFRFLYQNTDTTAPANEIHVPVQWLYVFIRVTPLEKTLKGSTAQFRLMDYYHYWHIDLL